MPICQVPILAAWTLLVLVYDKRLWIMLISRVPICEGAISPACDLRRRRLWLRLGQAERNLRSSQGMAMAASESGLRCVWIRALVH